MIKATVLVCFIALVHIGNCRISEKLRNILTCTRYDPDLEECVTASLMRFRRQLLQGIPEFPIQNFDPMVIPEVTVMKGAIWLFQIEARGRNVQVYGASNFEISNLKMNLARLRYTADIYFPELRFQSNYEMGVNGFWVRGPMTATATEVHGNCVLQGKLIRKNGDEYLTFTSLHLNILMNDIEMRVDNLFNGDANLENLANQFLHDNRMLFINIVKPFVETTTADVVLDIGNKFVKDIKYSELLPED